MGASLVGCVISMLPGNSLGMCPFACALLGVRVASSWAWGLTIQPVSSIPGDRSENSIVLVCLVTVCSRR